MKLIGIHGSIGHGKTTFADQLAMLEPNSIHLESSQLIAQVSDAWHATLPNTMPVDQIAGINQWLVSLPPILKTIVSVDSTVAQLQFIQDDVAIDPTSYQKIFEHTKNLEQYPELITQRITLQNKSQFRPVLQWLGGYLVSRVSPTIWYDELVRQAQTAANSGCELTIIGGVRYPADAKVIKNAKGLVIEIVRPGLSSQDLSDPTEKYRQQIVSDSVIKNNGTIEQLSLVAKQFLQDLVDDRTRHTYSADN